MTKKLERLGLDEDRIFDKNGKEVKAKILGLGIINDPDDPICGNYISPMADAYIVGERESQTLNRFPIIYLKKL